MKSRSEAKAERAKKAVEEAPEPKRKYNGLKCSACGHLQFETPSGATCANGHGGANGFPAEEDFDPDPDRSDEGSEDHADEKPAPEKKTPKNPFVWPNANRRRDDGGESALREDVQRVVESVWIDNVHAEWKDLEAALQLGDKRSEHAHVIRALDMVAARADRAHRLYLTAKLARDRWESENETVWGAMWSKATHALQEEKKAGDRSKQITDADVRARVATMFPDEYRAQEDRRRSVELTVRALERLSDIWFAKMRNMDSHATKLRG